MSKNKKNREGIVYSTDPDFKYHLLNDLNVDSVSTDIADMKLRVSIDRKQRGGKEVTLITGFTGSDADLTQLGKTLKTKCGVGGAAKDKEIILQGNHKEKVIKLLVAMGYTGTKGTGGG